MVVLVIDTVFHANACKLANTGNKNSKQPEKCKHNETTTNTCVYI